MRRCAFIGFLISFAIAPLFAQAPKGWLLRVDRSTSASDPDAAGSGQLAMVGDCLHAPTPPAAGFWTPTNTATVIYTLRGTFTLLRPSGHTNYYGLVFG